MYISRPVKTRTPILVFLYIRHPVSLSPLLLARVLSSLLDRHLHLFSYSLSHLYLLLVYLGGSAIMPSHVQRGPSVAIPSVQIPQLSPLWLHPHYKSSKSDQHLAKHYIFVEFKSDLP
jgi:hypothetical protein